MHIYFIENMMKNNIINNFQTAKKIFHSIIPIKQHADLEQVNFKHSGKRFFKSLLVVAGTAIAGFIGIGVIDPSLYQYFYNITNLTNPSIFTIFCLYCIVFSPFLLFIPLLMELSPLGNLFFKKIRKEKKSLIQSKNELLSLLTNSETQHQLLLSINNIYLLLSNHKMNIKTGIIHTYYEEIQENIAIKRYDRALEYITLLYHLFNGLDDLIEKDDNLLIFKEKHAQFISDKLPLPEMEMEMEMNNTKLIKPISRNRYSL